MMRSAEEGGADAEGRHQFFNKPLVIKTAQNTPAEVYNAASSFLRHPVCLSITLFAKTQLTNAQYYIRVRIGGGHLVPFGTNIRLDYRLTRSKKY